MEVSASYKAITVWSELKFYLNLTTRALHKINFEYPLSLDVLVDLPRRFSQLKTLCFEVRPSDQELFPDKLKEAWAGNVVTKLGFRSANNQTTCEIIGLFPDLESLDLYSEIQQNALQAIVSLVRLTTLYLCKSDSSDLSLLAVLPCCPITSFHDLISVQRIPRIAKLVLGIFPSWRLISLSLDILSLRDCRSSKNLIDLSVEIITLKNASN